MFGCLNADGEERANAIDISCTVFKQSKFSVSTRARVPAFF